MEQMKTHKAAPGVILEKIKQGGSVSTVEGSVATMETRAGASQTTSHRTNVSQLHHFWMYTQNPEIPAYPLLTLF